jgi:FTR1 family protein
MFEGLIVTLREGVEAALVIAIALAFLRRRGLSHLVPALAGGVALALASSVVVAWLALRITWDEELAEGIALLTGAVLVATLVVWMWRAAPRMKRDLEAGMEKASGGSAPGVFLFGFAMVFREGVETAIFLSAAAFDRSGLALWIGALVGLALAVVFGVLFVRGSLRVPLRPFFSLTTAVLALLAVQLLVGGLHELSEAGVLPASRREMALIGPFVKNEMLLFTLTVALAAGWLLLRRPEPAAAAADAGPAARLARAERARDRAWRGWTAAVGLLVVAVFTSAFVQRARTPDRPPASPVALQGETVTIEAAPLADGRAHFYEVTLPERPLRFFAVKVGDELKVCVDACEICGDYGYYEDGLSLVCRNCTSPIVRTTLGRSGGCNPIPLPHQARDGGLVIAATDLRRALPFLGGR